MAVLAMDLGARGLVLHQREAEHAVMARALLRQPLLDQPVEHAVDRDAVHVAIGRQAVDHGLVRERVFGVDQTGEDGHARLRHARAQLAQARLRGFQRGVGERSGCLGGQMRGGACHAGHLTIAPGSMQFSCVSGRAAQAWQIRRKRRFLAG
ncbi:hypothetical protein D3C81_1829190 [compost metagenome]